MIEAIEAGIGETASGQIDVLEILLVGALAVLGALILHRVVFALLRKFAKKSASMSDDIVIRHLANPVQFAFVAAAIILAASEAPALGDIWNVAGNFLVPALIGWIALAVVRALVETMTLRADISVADNLKARRRRTKLALFGRIATFVIVFVVVALVLLSIPGIREIGITLIASAGIAGLAVGAAMQPALKSLVGGIQMTVTEPFNIDDVIVIDGEWGRIEDIRTTYVVIKTWDERRLIVPASRFLEETFQNWTRTGAELLGTVILYLDPGAKVAPVREQFEKTLRENQRWDGRVQAVQVTDTQRDAKEVRLLMSARDAPTLFDLRCDIREALLEWLGENCPESFPRTRLATEEPIELQPGKLLAA